MGHTPLPNFSGNNPSPAPTLPTPPPPQTDRQTSQKYYASSLGTYGGFLFPRQFIDKNIMPEFFLSKELTSLVIMTQFLTVFPYSLCRFEKMSTDKKEKKFM